MLARKRGTHKDDEETLNTILSLKGKEEDDTSSESEIAGETILEKAQVQRQDTLRDEVEGRM